MFFSAWRPNLIGGLLPVVGTAFFFLTGFAMRDIALDTLSTSQVYTLCGLGIALAVMVWTWLADRGYFIRHMWKNLSADQIGRASCRERGKSRVGGDTEQ